MKGACKVGGVQFQTGQQTQAFASPTFIPGENEDIAVFAFVFFTYTQDLVS
jgi:hypothetical protein